MSEMDDVDFETDPVNGVDLKRCRATFRMLSETSHAALPPRLIKRIVLSLTKPSYVLGLGGRNIRVENRYRLRSLLKKLVRQQNWNEAAGVLSVLLKGTWKENSPENNRIKYWVAMELLKHIEGDHITSMKMRNIYDIWMRKIGSMKSLPVKDKFVVQLEFILLCLTQGNVEEAHQAALCLMQERDFGSEPYSSMLVGLTYYQLWYSTLPKELKFRYSEDFLMPVQSDILGPNFTNLVENSNGQCAVGAHEADMSIMCDSETSVRNDKSLSLCSNVNVQEEESVEVGVSLEKEEADQGFQPQGFYLNSVENSGNEETPFLNYGGNMHPLSIFFSPGRLDPWLLPIKLPIQTENCKDLIRLHKEIQNDYYYGAIKHFRLALQAVPPVMAALLPLVQLLLLGDQAKDALDVLENFCHNSNAAMPLRLKASLLEHFDRKNWGLLSNCYENILKKDPTCSHSLERLISVHKEGDYCPERLLEMVALHLDATYPECSIWREFAMCFLTLCQGEEDQMSICPGADRPRYTVRYNRTPKMFMEDKLAKAWNFRCKWWLTRHYSGNMLDSEIASGDLPLLTYKAACASHMYGQEFPYVVKAYNHLEEEKASELFSFLRMHLQRSIRLYLNIQQ